MFSKDLHEVILAFDLQNEPLIASPYLLSANDPSSWLCNRAKTLRSVLGSSKVKIATGGIGGSEYSGHEYNLLPAALNCADIDIMSIHGYMSTETQWTPYVSALCEQSARSGKLCFIEEWGVGTGTGDDSVAVQAALFNEWGVPWVCPVVSSPPRSCDPRTNLAMRVVVLDGHSGKVRRSNLLGFGWRMLSCWAKH